MHKTQQNLSRINSLKITARQTAEIQSSNLENSPRKVTRYLHGNNNTNEGVLLIRNHGGQETAERYL